MSDRGVHDIGGLRAGPIDTSDHVEETWQCWINATFTTMIAEPRRIIRIDELRRAMEDLGEEAYGRLAYFERQTQGFADLLVEKGILGREEIEQRAAEIRGKRETE